jgi:NitT/TauT family transport system substrate-binding protein
MRVASMRWAAVVAFVTAGLLVPQARAQTVTMASVGSASASLWPVFVGLQNGFFAAEGIKVDLVFVPSNAGLAQQVAAGSIDVGLNSGLVGPIQAIDKGAPVAIVRLEITPAPFILMGKPDVPNVAALKGKRISVGGAKDITRILTDRMLRAAGVDPASVDYSYAGATPARVAALKSGAVDAAIVLPPYNYYTEEEGYRTLGLTKDVAPDMPFAGSVVNTKWAAANKDAVAKILTVNDKSVAWLYDPKNRDRAIAILMDASKGQKRDVEKAYDFMVEGRFFEPTSVISRKKLDSVINALVEIGDIEKPVPFDKLVLSGSSTSD